MRLFDRRPHGSQLTPAGRAFLVQANELLGAARHAVTNVRAAATSGTITIGYMPGLPITPAVRDLRERHPDAAIHTRYLTWENGLIRPDLTAIPVDGLPPCQAVMLTGPVEDNGMVDEFRRSALSCLPG